jgi:hypothetical protein
MRCLTNSCMPRLPCHRSALYILMQYREEVLEIHVSSAGARTETLTVLCPLDTLFAPGFAARVESGKIFTLDDVSPEHFDVFIGWLRTCCLKDPELFAVLGYEVEWGRLPIPRDRLSASLPSVANVLHSSYPPATAFDGGISSVNS